MEQYIFTLDEPAAAAEYLEYYVEKCQDIMTSLFPRRGEASCEDFPKPDTTKTMEFVGKNLRILQSAMERSSCMRLVGDKELPELTPNEEDSLVRAVVGLVYQYSEIFGDTPHLTTFDELFKYYDHKVSTNLLIRGIQNMIKDLDQIGLCSNSIFGRDAFCFYLSRMFAYADYLEINLETRTNVLYGIYVGSVDIDAEPTTCGGKVQAIVWTGDKLSIHPFPAQHSVEYLNQIAIMNKDKIAKLSKILHDNVEEFGDAAGDLWEHYGNLLRAVEVDKLLLDITIALRGHENIRFAYK